MVIIKIQWTVGLVTVNQWVDSLHIFLYKLSTNFNWIRTFM